MHYAAAHRGGGRLYQAASRRFSSSARRASLTKALASEARPFAYLAFRPIAV